MFKDLYIHITVLLLSIDYRDCERRSLGDCRGRINHGLVTNLNRNPDRPLEIQCGVIPT